MLLEVYTSSQTPIKAASLSHSSSNAFDVNGKTKISPHLQAVYFYVSLSTMGAFKSDDEEDDF